MPRFSKRSAFNLLTCHKDLQTLFNEVIKTYDCTVTCGFRNRADQEKAFAEGNTKLRFPRSKHNTSPSRAVDVVPYPIDWNNIARFKEMAAIVKAVAKKLKAEGKITHDITWGGDWKTFKDYPHWEIK